MSDTLAVVPERRHSALNRAVGAEIDGLRSAAGLTQKQLSAAIDEADLIPVSVNTLQRIEAGTTPINMDHLDSICRVLGADVVEVFRRAERRLNPR